MALGQCLGGTKTKSSEVHVGLELWALLSLYGGLKPRESTAALIAQVFSGHYYPVVADWPFQKGGGFKAKEIRC